MPMRLTLAHRLYLAAGRLRRQDISQTAQEHPRPSGSLLWVCVGHTQPLEPILTLAERIAAEQGDTSILISSSRSLAVPSDAPPQIIVAKQPLDTLASISAFLDHWRPNSVCLGGSELWPAIIKVASDRGIPVLGLETTSKAGHVPALIRRSHMALAAGLDQLVAASDLDAEALLNSGIQASAICGAGPLEQAGLPLPYIEAERSEIASELGGRPVWLAAHITSDELDVVSRAHRIASRLSHRLLLILVPRDLDRSMWLRETLISSGWAVGLRSAGDSFGDDFQVMVADTEGEMGLWYRVAPVTFCGSSLATGESGRNPFEPAALGSAVLSGPNVSAHRARYARLDAVGAVRFVNHGEDLGAAVAELLSPDRAADMANKAWRVTSEGAEVTDQAVEMILDHLALGRG